jgi:hypothetical protein
MTSVAPRHLRSLFDLTPAETMRVVSLAAEVKRDPSRFRAALAGKSVALVFAKRSDAHARELRGRREPARRAQPWCSISRMARACRWGAARP